MNKWQALLDTKPKPLSEHLLDEAGKLFAKDLSQWPPTVSDLDGREGQAVDALLKATPKRPDFKLYKEAFRLTRLDLAREFDAYDDYMRNQRWCEVGLAVSDKAVLLFLSRLITEQLLGLKEATQGRVTQKHLGRLLSRTEAEFFRELPS